MFKWLIVGDIAVAMLPKVASTSIMEMYQDGELPNSKAAPDNGGALRVPRRVMWIREPMDRLVSLYSWLHWSSKKGEPVINIPRESTLSWEALIDYILQHDDPHWEPQVERLTENGAFVPTEVHRFETLHETWPLPGPLPWLRPVRHEAVDLSYRSELLNDKYLEDRVLWLSVGH